MPKKKTGEKTEGDTNFGCMIPGAEADKDKKADEAIKKTGGKK